MRRDESFGVLSVLYMCRIFGILIIYCLDILCDLGECYIVLYSICLFNLGFIDCRQLSVRDETFPLLIVSKRGFYSRITITALLLYGTQVFPECGYVFRRRRLSVS
jgi:hypothetical protein